MTDRKVQIQFSPALLEKIEVCMTATERRTVADVVRDAVNVYDWMRRQVEDGYVISATKDDRTKELVLSFVLKRTKEKP